MTENSFYNKSVQYLKILCGEIGGRPVGSAGNREATRFFEKELSSIGWIPTMSEFDAMDWRENGATLRAGELEFEVLPSPYSLGCDVHADLVGADSMASLEKTDADGKVLLLHGEIAREQLMPKNFVFYNPERHQKIVALLEKSNAEAIVCATGRNAALAGGVYPFPLIEDGDFNLPSVYMTEQEVDRLLAYVGQQVSLKSNTSRIPAKGYNVVGKNDGDPSNRIVITAHIDAKKGTPGAIDNATGVIILLLLADLLKDYRGGKQIELVAFNGEDYYAVPGQMTYIRENQDKFSSILLNINIDGAGYFKGKSAFSLFNLPEDLQAASIRTIDQYPDLAEGIQWVQGDHSIFIQFGRPAIAVSSQWFIDNIDNQDIKHTPKDNMDIVDCNKLVEIAQSINYLVRQI